MAPLTPLLQMFAESPIRPLQLHMEKVHACVEALLPFFQAVLADNWERAHQLQQKIAYLEQEADNLKRELRLHLPKGIFLPVSRSDLLEVLVLQDELANKAKDIAGLVYGRQMHFAKELTELFLALLKRCQDAVKQAQIAIEELDELLEAGFRGDEVRIVENMIVELDKIEHATDEMQIDLRHKLFQLENTLPPVDVIFLYKLIEWIGNLADDAHSLGGQLHLLIAR